MQIRPILRKFLGRYSSLPSFHITPDNNPRSVALSCPRHPSLALSPSHTIHIILHHDRCFGSSPAPAPPVDTERPMPPAPLLATQILYSLRFSRRKRRRRFQRGRNYRCQLSRSRRCQRGRSACCCCERGRSATSGLISPVLS